MSEDILIRYAKPSDATLLSELGTKTFYDSFAADNTPENMTTYLNGAFNCEKQAQELADGTSRFLIAENNGTAVGYARLLFKPAPDVVVGRKPMEIARFYVQKEWINKGIGTRLMQSSLKAAKQADCDVVWLGVWEHNLRAIAFYRTWGFVKVGGQVFQLGNDAQQDWIMVLCI